MAPARDDNDITGAGGFIARVLSEVFSVAIPEDSVVRVSSSTPLFSTAIAGSTDGDTLSAAPVFP